MESHLLKTGDWQGTAMLPVSDTLAVFAFRDAGEDGIQIWTEPVLAWVMAERRYLGERGDPEYGTVFYGLAHCGGEPDGVCYSPEICEDIHDERGCLVGYQRPGHWDDTAKTKWMALAATHLVLAPSAERPLGSLAPSQIDGCSDISCGTKMSAPGQWPGALWCCWRLRSS